MISSSARGSSGSASISKKSRRTTPCPHSTPDMTIGFANSMKLSFENQKRRHSITIREFAAAEQKIRSGISLREFDFPWINEQVRPFGIISVDWEGNFSTYSPELLGISLEPYGDFFFGNVTREHFSDALETPKFRQVLSDIQAGIKRCTETCSYYGYCGRVGRVLPPTSTTRMARSHPHRPCIAAMLCSCAGYRSERYRAIFGSRWLIRRCEPCATRGTSSDASFASLPSDNMLDSFISSL